MKLPRIRIRRSSRPRYDRGTGASPAAVPVTALTAAAARQHLIPGTLRDVHDWIAYGVARGWVTEACATHDGIPSTPEEDALWEEGLDPCQHVLRLWPDGKPPARRVDPAESAPFFTHAHPDHAASAWGAAWREFERGGSDPG